MLGEIASDVLEGRVLVMRTMPQFSALDDDDLSLLAEHAHLSVARPGSVLFHEGEFIDRVYLMASGSVRINHGERSFVVPAKAEIGMHSLFAGREHALHVEVVQEATLIELPAKVVLSSFYDSVSIARNTIRQAARALLERRGNLPRSPLDPQPVDAGTHYERTPTLVEKIMGMRRSPVWANASLDAIAELCRMIEEQRVPAGTELWDIGDASTYSFSVQYGILTCTNVAGDSVRVGAGQLLGGLDALSGSVRSYRVVSETEAILFRIDASTQLAVLEVHPQLAARLRLELSRALLETV